MAQQVKDEVIRTAQKGEGKPFKILQEGEEFILQDRFYTNSDQSIILRSTNATGKIIRPTC